MEDSQLYWSIKTIVLSASQRDAAFAAASKAEHFSDAVISLVDGCGWLGSRLFGETRSKYRNPANETG